MPSAKLTLLLGVGAPKCFACRRRRAKFDFECSRVFFSLSRGKCVFIVFDDGMLIISGRVYVFLVLLSENTLQIPAEWNILYWSSFLGRGKAGGKRTDWRDFSVFVNLQIG